MARTAIGTFDEGDFRKIGAALIGLPAIIGTVESVRQNRRLTAGQIVATLVAVSALYTLFK